MRKPAVVACLLTVLVAGLTLPLGAQDQASPDWETREHDVAGLLLKSEAIAQSLSATVGTAISPLVGIAVLGASGYFRAEPHERRTLPWYNQPEFWLVAIGLLTLVAAKDTIGSTVPLVKKPLDALELVENQMSALVALPIVVPTVVRWIEQAGLTAEAMSWWGMPVVHAAQAAPVEAGGEAGWLTWLMVSLAATIVFVVVWFTGHVTNVLVFLNPIPFVDTVIKLMRLALIGVVATSVLVSPTLSIALSLVVFLVSLWLFGWSFRLTHLGTVMAWDILMRRDWTMAQDRDAPLRGFTTAACRCVPPRTYGHLRRRDDGALEIAYRRFLVWPEKILTLPTERHAVGRGLLSPVLVRRRTDDEVKPLFRFLPRYRGDEESLARAVALCDVCDASITRGFRRWARSLWREERAAASSSP